MFILSPVAGGGVSMAPIVAVFEEILEKLDEVATEVAKPAPKRRAKKATIKA